MPESVPDTPLGSSSVATLTAGRTGRAGALLVGRSSAADLPGPGASA
jgi:hypothetical protein